MCWLRNFHIGTPGTRGRKLGFSSMFLVAVLKHFQTWAILLYGISYLMQF